MAKKTKKTTSFAALYRDESPLGYIIHRAAGEGVGQVTPVYLLSISPLTKLLLVALAGDDKRVEVHRDAFFENVEEAEKALDKIEKIDSKLLKGSKYEPASRRMIGYCKSVIRRSTKYRFLKEDDLISKIQGATGIDLNTMSTSEARGLIGRFSKPFIRRRR